MTKKKLNLAYIANHSIRKTTLNKRTKGFVKKIHELSVLCGIEACAVIYSPFSSSPKVWPSKSGVKNVVEKFEMLVEMKQEKSMLNHESFLQQTISKTVESNNNMIKDTVERAMKEAMFQLLGGKGYELMLTNRNREDLCKYIDHYLKELYHHRNVTLNQSHIEYGESSSAVNVMAAKDIAEFGSTSFPNIDEFNFSQLGEELWDFRPIISSNQRPMQVNTFGSNFISTAIEQVDSHSLMEPVSAYNQSLNLNHIHNQYQQQFGYPTVGQDAVYNSKQNQIHQEEWSVDQMMNHSKKMEFSLMGDNNHYYHQQP